MDHMDYDDAWAAAQRATDAAILAADNWADENRDQLAQCTPAAAKRLRLQHALAFLVAHGLVTVAPSEQFQTWLSMDLPPELEQKMDAAVQAGIDEQARLLKAFFGGRP